jgi:uncharacterized membrane protein
MTPCSLVALLLSPATQFLGGAETGLIILRWIHFVAGITWIGLLYFFNLVNAPFMRELDAKTRGMVVPKLMTRALWWFRWSALVTVVAGMSYWMHIVATNARNAVAEGVPASAGMMFGSFFVLWTLAFVIEMGALMSPAEVLRKGPVLGAIVAVAVIAAAYVFLSVNQHGWENNWVLAIGIGGGLGWFMLLNVWGVVWRIQKKLIRWTEANASQGTAMPPETPKLATIALLCTRLNFWLSFPMLFFMGAASHYMLFAAK